MRKNIFITYMIVVLVSLLITGIFSVKTVEGHFIKNTEDLLANHAEILQAVLSLESPGYESLPAKFEELTGESGEYGTRVTVIDLNGRVIADTHMDSTIMGNHGTRPEIKRAFDGFTGKSIRYSSSLRTNMLYVAVPVERNGKIIGALRMSLPLSRIYEISKSIWKAVFYSIFAGLLIAFFMSSFFSRKVTKPVEQIAKAAEDIAAGNYNMRIGTNYSGEIKTLAESFNHMTENLSRIINELQEGKAKTEAVLSSMAEALIAVDCDCNVIMINSAAEKLFGIEGIPSGKHLLEMIRNRELLDSIKEVLTKKTAVNKEIKIVTSEERIFRINVVPVCQKKNFGAVAILRDITDLRKLEKVRTEFVANVSHELKTPLTSISGFVETLLDGAYKSKDHCRYFLGIIKQETDRMNRLINELLYFSKIERSPAPISKTYVDLVEVIMKALSILQTAVNEKKHKVKLNIPESINKIFSNEDSLLQIIINLLDNAIKYTPEGGKIDITLKEDLKHVSITVADNGPGIDENEQERIFERFYRVDRARSGKTGGTGLGLALVKHLVKGLEGKVTVKSKLGEGSAFTVHLPKIE